MAVQREHELIRRERQAAQEEALAEALSQQKTAEEARLREIQQICESDPMLRELQEKIKVCARWCASVTCALAALPASLCARVVVAPRVWCHAARRTGR